MYMLTSHHSIPTYPLYLSPVHHCSYISPSGVYGCHLWVQTPAGSVVRGVLTVTVSAKPIVAVHTHGGLSSRVEQYVSGDKVDILCLVDGYPLSTITWSFPQRRKRGSLGAASNEYGE